MAGSPLLEVARTLLHPGSDSADYGAASSGGEWLEVDWSKYRKSMRLRERDIVYVDMGPAHPTGPDTIVFVHGLGGCWQTFLEQIPHFSRTHRCIALDLPGFGRSEMPRDDISIDMYGQVVSELCEELGVERATVVGNSMGGFIGAEMAIATPTLVERLVLVSAAVFWQEYRRAQPLLALAKASEASVGRAVVHGQKAVKLRPRIRAAALSFGGFRYPHLLSTEMQMEMILHARRTAGFVPGLASLATYRLRDDLPKIACPTLVVWGAQDTLVSVRHANELEDLIPNSRRIIYERTGHLPMVERPQRFNADLEEFLSEPVVAPQRPAAATPSPA